jgi:hypothetical protein
MYIWKVDNLIQDFKSKRVSQLDQFKYLLVYALFIPFSTTSKFNFDGTTKMPLVVEDLLYLLTTLGGLYYCYYINKKGDDKDFVNRMMCLGVPVFFRAMSVFIPVLFGIFFIQDVANIHLVSFTTNEPKPFGIVLYTIFDVLFYWYLGKKVGSISS